MVKCGRSFSHWRWTCWVEGLAEFDLVWFSLVLLFYTPATMCDCPLFQTVINLPPTSCELRDQFIYGWSANFILIHSGFHDLLTWHQILNHQCWSSAGKRCHVKVMWQSYDDHMMVIWWSYDGHMMIMWRPYDIDLPTLFHLILDFIFI